MAEYGSSRYPSETNDDYDLSLSTSLSSKASKEIYLSGPPLEMEVQPYCFEPVLSSTTLSTTDCDIDDGVHCTAISESSLVECMENADW